MFHELNKLQICIIWIKIYSYYNFFLSLIIIAGIFMVVKWGVTLLASALLQQPWGCLSLCSPFPLLLLLHWFSVLFFLFLHVLLVRGGRGRGGKEKRGNKKSRQEMIRNEGRRESRRWMEREEESGGRKVRGGESFWAVDQKSATARCPWGLSAQVIVTQLNTKLNKLTEWHTLSIHTHPSLAVPFITLLFFLLLKHECCISQSLLRPFTCILFLGHP